MIRVQSTTDSFFARICDEKVLRLLIYVVLRALLPLRAMFAVRFFPLSEVGSFLFAHSLVQFMLSTSDLGLQNFFSPEDRKSNLGRISAGITLSIAAAAVATILLFCFSFFQNSYLNANQVTYVRLLCITVLFASLYFPTTVSHSEQQFVRASLPKLVQEIVTFTLMVVFYLQGLPAISALCGSYLIGMISGIAVSWKLVGTLKFVMPTISDFREVWRFGIPYVGFQCLTLCINQLDKIAVGYLSTPESLAKYASVYQAVFAVVGLAVVLEEMFVPVLRGSGKSTKDVKDLRNMNILWGFSSVFFGYSLWLQPMLFTRIFFGRSFPELNFTCEILGLTLAAKGICGVGWLASAYASNQTALLRQWSLVNLVLMIVVGFPLIREFGPDGAAVFWLLHTLFSIIPTAIFFLRKSKFGLEQIYPALLIFSAGTISALLVFSQKENSGSVISSLRELCFFLTLFILLTCAIVIFTRRLTNRGNNSL